MVVFKMRDSVPTARYSPICNVLRQWKTSLIRIYRVYRLYDRVFRVAVNTYVSILFIILKMLRSEATAGVICLPRMSLTTPDPQNTDTNGIHATWAGPYYSRFQLKTLRSEVTAHSFTFFNSFTDEGAIMRRARATFCGRRRNIVTTYGCVPYPEATMRYGREKCQDTTLRPRVPPLSNVPDRREL